MKKCLKQQTKIESSRNYFPLGESKVSGSRTGAAGRFCLGCQFACMGGVCWSPEGATKVSWHLVGGAWGASLLSPIQREI